MLNKRRLSVIACAAAVLTAAAACSSKKNSSSDTQPATESTTPAATQYDGSPAAANSEMEITWLADYDLNPQPGGQRSAALTLFEDIFGGRINCVYTSPKDKYERLSSMRNSGEAVDMFPCEAGAFPNGTTAGLFDPLDPYFTYMGMDDGLWSDMSDVTDMFAYKGQHYVVPYSISEPAVLTYSRKLMESEGLDDPRKLWQEGKWDWNAMKGMIEKFRNNQPDAPRYGINGWYGQAALASTGHTVVGFDGVSFSNNIGDAEIGKAVGLMSEIKNNGWYSSTLRDTFPSDLNTLFYASGSWSLGISNAANPEADLMIVPFPKSPDADKNYISCDVNARMLVKNSQKGKAVATYLKCERLAASDETMKAAAKEQALVQQKNASGSFRSFITEEQYNALQEYLDLSKVTPVFDCGWGMGEAMSGNGNYTPDSRGIMQKITETDSISKTYEQLRDELSPAIDGEVSKLNSLS
ncbi:ABC transporter substrate-binding protein [Ruminococcus flavefaciens]|uniref:ABC-type glycerol-3-phosphate transport system substrate-binding protein n=1 Tax=Ruminococcus flavefaciens TaxID=1265 RepID=A0A315XY38_RUMFL|nr:extracellular solute-binding protein [Ruminococcus flavefaciens]PWJ10559.1 ABC-type glycerol-3-phosphate transport system substrate-binding protein [Ruminococcus flavefaciens]SSA51610.1 extracellular solute-binding protein [Ruminococcus flavefaciens]